MYYSMSHCNKRYRSEEISPGMEFGSKDKEDMVSVRGEMDIGFHSCSSLNEDLFVVAVGDGDGDEEEDDNGAICPPNEDCLVVVIGQGRDFLPPMLPAADRPMPKSTNSIIATKTMPVPIIIEE